MADTASIHLNQLCSRYRAASGEERRQILGELHIEAERVIAPLVRKLKHHYHIVNTIHDEVMDDAMRDHVQRLADHPNTDPDNFRALLTSTVSNKAIDVIRKVKRDRRVLTFGAINSDDAAIENLTSSQVTAHYRTPSDEIDRMEESVIAATRNVSKDLLNTYALRLDGLSYEEIGRKMGLAVGTVKSRLHKVQTALNNDPHIHADEIDTLLPEQKTELLKRLSKHFSSRGNTSMSL